MFPRWESRVLLALVAVPLAACSHPIESGGVDLYPVLAPTFPGAAEPGSLHRACASEESTLAAFFAARQLPFSPGLLTGQDRRKCHIFYEPTIPGFRAFPEDAAISELLMNVDTLAFLSKRNEVAGDGLDVAKQILPRLPRPLTVTLGLAGGFVDSVFQDALRHHFPRSIHAFRRHRNPTAGYNPWAQDFLKFGSAGGSTKILVTRMAFEGDAVMGADMRPILDSFHEERSVRSKLSWEGGDLQFAVHPKDPGKLVLFYGTTAKRYWGEGLSRAEFEYVLRVEFGANLALYLGDVTPHVDYQMSILPAGPIALISKPVCGDRGLARAALDLLLRKYSGSTPPELTELDKLWSSGGELSPAGVEAARGWIERAKQVETNWRKPFAPPSAAQANAYLAENCPNDTAACLQGEGLPSLLSNHMDFLRTWARAAVHNQMETLMAARLLSVMEGQLSPCDLDAATVMQRNAAALQAMGFRVIRMPSIPGASDRMSPWAGISYVNALVMDQTIFLPKLGLGPKENAWFDQLKTDLPGTYHVIPVDARLLLFANGGVHCAMAFGRAAWLGAPKL